MAAWPSPTKTYHTSTYPTIDPTKPELSQQDKNIVITGAGSGIGRAIALSFARAGASTIALLGRTQTTLAETQDLIRQANPDVRTYIHLVDITDEVAVDRVFAQCASDAKGSLHVLLANAAKGGAMQPLSTISTKELQDDLLSNTVGTHLCIKVFLKHVPAASTAAKPGEYSARVIHTSSGVASLRMPYNGPYSVSKTAALRVVESYASENTHVWFTSFHPGLIETAVSAPAAAAGLKLEFDDVSLPADWTVWAASQEAAFIPSGRFLWAHWDIDELKPLFDDPTSQGIPVMGGMLHTETRFTLGVMGCA